MFSLAAMLPILCGCAGLPLTEEGRTEYRIVLPADASDNMKYAAYELKLHLDEASGGEFPIVYGSQNTEKQILLLENDPELEAGEFRIRTEGQKLLLSGGGESGIHHAVHDFLETDCGYIWYDARGGKKVPDMKNFKLPEIDRRKKYPFSVRYMSPDFFFYRPEGHYFLYRNGLNLRTRLFPLPGMNSESLNFKVLAGNGVNELHEAAPMGSTSFDYMPDVPGRSPIKALRDKGYFKDHPEYFSMDQEGKRIARQLCFSNPELRAEFKKNVYEHIRNNPNKNVFCVTACDQPGQLCYCEECQNAVRKYNTKGAPILLFVKELAQDVEKDFPGVRIFTYAYRKEQTEFPPSGMKLPDNVILCFCPLDDDMGKDWTSEVNAETYRNLKEWKNVCSTVWLYYYVNPWTFGLTTPAVGNIYRCAKDTVLARNAGATGCYYSHPLGVPSMTGFTELQSYLMASLMRDPDRDIDALIDDFMSFEYGPAAPLMRTYLNELEKVAAETHVFVPWNAVIGLWSAFFPSTDAVRWQGYFDRMEELTASNPEMNFSVRRVRIPLDLLTLRFYQRIRKEAPEYKTDVQTLAARIKSVYHQATAAFYTQSIPQIKRHKENHDKKLDRMVDDLMIQSGTEPKGLPDDLFKGIDPALIFEYFPESMKKSALVKDPDAAWGYARFNDTAVQGFPIQILEVDEVRHRWEIISEIRSAREGMEGKYCFYKIGETAISPNYQLRLHFREYDYLFRIFPGNAWMPGTDDTVTIYASLKLTGPKYYPGSKEKDSIACDRIVVVRKSND